VDRMMNCYQAGQGMQIFAKAFPVGTCLDGEIVQNRKWNRLIFMVFDMLTYGGESLVTKTFEDRYKYITSTVMAAYAKVVGDQMPPMPMVRKKWFPSKQVSEVLSKLQKDPDGSECYVDGPSRHHKSDGLILVPNRHYARGTDFELFKFKEGTTMTLDFQVAWDPSTELGITTWFDGPGHQQIDFSNQMSLPVHDRARLYGDMGQKQQAVCEFAFNPECGKWEYKLIRHDKDKSNYYITILDTIAALAENVTQDELEFRMLCSSSEQGNEWDREMKRATKAVLEKKKQSARHHQR